MENKYYGKKEELDKAKEKGFSSKAKKFIASALIGGNMLFAGMPAQAMQYTDAQLATHNKRVEEVEAFYDSILTEIKPALEKEVKMGVTPKEVANSILDKFHQERKKDVTRLQAKYTNIDDKNLTHINVLPPQHGDTKTRISLNLNNITSLNQKQIESLEKNYLIDSIVMNRFYETELDGDPSNFMFKYSPETYKKLLATIDDKFGDLKKNKDLTDLEKTLVVLKRMEHITYDREALTTPYLDEHNNLNPKAWTSRNMEAPLFENSGICAGYSDLFKNVMAYLNIESKEIMGYYKGAEITTSTIPGQSNHAWNQVKIDGKWYNVDITQINVGINMLEKNSPHPYVFVSDKEFNAERMYKENDPKYVSKYRPISGLHENAQESMPNEKIDAALETVINYEKQRAENLAKSTNKQRKEFMAYLSNNGEYRNLHENSVHVDAPKQTQERKNGEIER